MKKYLTFFIISIVGCSPVYRTFYDYKPITNSSGKTCVNGCLSIKQNCISTAVQDYNSCRNRSELAYQLCKSREIYGYNKEGEVECVQNCYCSQETCVDYSGNCEDPYKDCYVNCGGTVVATTRCVSNCDEAAPATQEVFGEKPKTKKYSVTTGAQKKTKEEKPALDADAKLRNMTEAMKGSTQEK